MKINLKDHKTCVFGIQGSGKTFLVERFLITQFKKPLVYQIHPKDFISCKNNVMLYEPVDLSLKKLDEFCITVKKMAVAGKCDAFIIDEGDMYLSGQLLPRNILDLVLNHRHYELALIIISRRPQDIPTKIIESCKHIFVFQIEGDNVMKKMKAIHPKFEELLPKLDDKHNFIYKQIGHEPKLYSKINLEKEKKENDRKRKN